jgi:hypothetical protein
MQSETIAPSMRRTWSRALLHTWGSDLASSALRSMRVLRVAFGIMEKDPTNVVTTLATQALAHPMGRPPFTIESLSFQSWEFARNYLMLHVRLSPWLGKKRRKIKAMPRTHAPQQTALRFDTKSADDLDVACPNTFSARIAIRRPAFSPPALDIRRVQGIS